MKSYSIGIDIGGTKITAGIVNTSGDIIDKQSISTHAEKDPQIVIDSIGEIFNTLLDNSKKSIDAFEGVGVGFPGNTDGRAGVVLTSSNLPNWDHFPLRDTLNDLFGLPVTLDNDTNLCTLGEYVYGAGRGTQNMCYLTLSTGTGLGIIVRGKLLTGNNGTAGELGHVVIDIDGPRCTCGKRGCIMAYASGVGISRMVYEAIEAKEETELQNNLPSNGQRVKAEIVVEASERGDAVATRILETAGLYSGIALSIIIQVLNPEMVVIGGGLTKAGPILLEAAVKSMKKHTQPEIIDSAQVELSHLGR